MFKLRVLQLFIFSLFWAHSFQTAEAGCLNLISWLKPSEPVAYDQVHDALFKLQGSVANLRELSSRKLSGRDKYTLEDYANPKLGLSVAGMKEEPADLATMLQSLKAISSSLEVLSNPMNEPAQKLVEKNSLALLNLLVLGVVYSNSVNLSLRVLKKLQEAPDYLNVRTPEVLTTSEAVSFKKMDKQLTALVTRLAEKLDASGQMPAELCSAVDEYLKRNSNSRIPAAVEIMPVMAGKTDPSDYSAVAAEWNSFVEGRKKIREATAALRLPKLVLPELDASIQSVNASASATNAADAPTKPGAQEKGIIDEGLASELGLKSDGEATVTEAPKKNGAGIIPKTAEQRQRALDLMPRRQREAAIARNAQDAKLRAARGAGGKQ